MKPRRGNLMLPDLVPAWPAGQAEHGRAGGGDGGAGTAPPGPAPPRRVLFDADAALDRFQEPPGIVADAVLEDRLDLPEVADRLERVARQDDEIGRLAGLEGAHLPVDAEELRPVERRHLEGLDRRQARLD